MIQPNFDRPTATPKELQRFEESKRMLPLLRSYAREIVERRHRVLELRIELAGSPGAIERGHHLNELRRIERELERMGWYVGEEEPPYFYRLGKDGEPELAWAPLAQNAV
ncbi:MAG: hypothetical protein IT453_01830 [Planctomycetes bacterium]|nr:hypothetical protein [Planctomycetota bacterium]